MKVGGEVSLGERGFRGMLGISMLSPCCQPVSASSFQRLSLSPFPWLNQSRTINCSQAAASRLSVVAGLISIARQELTADLAGVRAVFDLPVVLGMRVFERCVPAEGHPGAAHRGILQVVEGSVRRARGEIPPTLRRLLNVLLNALRNFPRHQPRIVQV